MEINTEEIHPQTNNLNETNPIIEKQLSHKENVPFYYEGDIYLLNCDEDELFSSLLKKFKEKSKTENVDLYFIANGERVNPEIKLSYFIPIISYSIPFFNFYNLKNVFYYFFYIVLLLPNFLSKDC